ncbi:MAG: dimethylarginine dimethylaminohydrolase [Proteobacteria bacterium]|nr:dimethylarginine dimethylaminohydrolase [Pseudomonadota bacterium]
MNLRVFDFDRAILRTPAATVVDGLRAGTGPSPDAAGVLAEHSAYAAALRAAGVTTDILPPLPQYPDSMFVEDPALTFPEGAILLRPGAPSRLGEAPLLRAALQRHFVGIAELTHGFADGGDVLVTPSEVLIGLSARTDREGAQELARLLAAIGRRARIVSTPAGVLHLKTACALLDEQTILTTRACAAAGLFAGFDLVVLDLAEEAAANSLRINDTLLVPDRFPGTLELLAARGYRVVPLPTTQVARIDAGLSCMSLRWHTPENPPAGAGNVAGARP